jgi:BirA family biotin operon repressor/biotin-[acetyl-CoA-carboxylase] ligase
VLLRPPPALPAPQLSLVGGLAAALAAEEALGLSAQIKWPNDVMVDRRKVAGVLAESREGVIVLGIGINVNQTREQLPSDARVAPGSLRTIDGVVRDREEVLASLLERLDLFYRDWREGGLDAVYEDLGARDFLRGRRVTVDGVEGTATMVTRDGRLAIETASGLVLVESGEVVFER